MGDDNDQHYEECESCGVTEEDDDIEEMQCCARMMCESCACEENDCDS